MWSSFYIWACFRVLTLVHLFPCLFDLNILNNKWKYYQDLIVATLLPDSKHSPVIASITIPVEVIYRRGLDEAWVVEEDGSGSGITGSQSPVWSQSPDLRRPRHITHEGISIR